MSFRDFVLTFILDYVQKKYGTGMKQVNIGAKYCYFCNFVLKFSFFSCFVRKFRSKKAMW